MMDVGDVLENQREKNSERLIFFIHTQKNKKGIADSWLHVKSDSSEKKELTCIRMNENQ